MDYTRLSEILYPDVIHDCEYYENKYPERNLHEGAKVTRIAPSPTGFVHFGSIFPALVSERLARQSGGVFYLRIEDTDEKRSVKGAVEDIIKSFDYFGINFDEGVMTEGDNGSYGPYTQSERVDIYQTYAKKLVASGRAYPCFCDAETLAADKNAQSIAKEPIGYYGKYAHCESLSLDDIEGRLRAGEKFVLRFRADATIPEKVIVNDLIKGRVEITENNSGRIMIKSDGIPTYHLAHAVDDHLMRTTHVIRGEEWLSSLAFHIQLFTSLGFKPPKYMHIAQLMKLEGTSKKKLSKRDKGSGLKSYIKEGYPAESVIEYVLGLLNSNFEDWRRANPDLPYNDFPFSIKKMSASGALFDLVKLNDVSRNVISRFTAEKVFEKLLDWTKSYDKEFYKLLSADKNYAESILSIGRGGAKARKDFALWSELRPYMSFFYDELFERQDKIEGFNENDVKAVTSDFVNNYNPDDDQNEWFAKVKQIAADNGFCPDMKQYKQNPEDFKGSVADVSMFLRVAVTGRQNSPDLWSVMQILGKDRVVSRLTSYNI